jgi:hypothetical protein
MKELGTEWKQRFVRLFDTLIEGISLQWDQPTN